MQIQQSGELDVSTAARAKTWLSRHALLPWSTLAFLVLGFLFLRHQGEDCEWRRCFVRAARRLAQGEHIHRIEPNAYAYPPAMAMFSIPLAHLPPKVSLVGWYLVNVFATCVVFTCAWRLVGGPPLNALYGHWKSVFALAVFLAFRFVSAPMETQQFDIVITALALVGCVRLGQGRDWSASIWLGLASAMKLTPLLFAPMLLWRGRPKAACMVLLVAALVNRVPDWAFPQQNGQPYLADWSQTFLGEVGRSGPGVWYSDVLLNQSLAGMFHRWVHGGASLLWNPEPSHGAERTTVSIALLRWLVYGSGLALGVISAWRFGWGRKWHVPTPTERPLGWHHLRLPIEAASVFCLMLLLSPMSSKAHYIVLLLPCMLLARAAIEQPLPHIRWLFVPLVLFGPLTAKGLIGNYLGKFTLAWGLPTWFVIVMLFAMWRLVSATYPTAHANARASALARARAA